MIWFGVGLKRFEKKEIDMEVLGLSLFPSQKLAGTSERRPFLISQIKASVFVSARLAMIPGTSCKRKGDWINAW